MRLRLLGLLWVCASLSQAVGKGRVRCTQCSCLQDKACNCPSLVQARTPAAEAVCSSEGKPLPQCDPMRQWLCVMLTHHT